MLSTRFNSPIGFDNDCFAALKFVLVQTKSPLLTAFLINTVGNTLVLPFFAIDCCD